MDRRQLLTRTAVGGALWITPSVVTGHTAFAAGSPHATTTMSSTTIPTGSMDLVSNGSFENAAAYMPPPNWAVTGP